MNETDQRNLCQQCEVPLEGAEHRLCGACRHFERAQEQDEA